MSQTEIISLKKGELAFSEGEVVDSLFLIQSGQVQVYVERNNNQIEIDRFAGNQLISVGSLSSKSKQSVSAVALTNTKMVKIPILDLAGDINTLSSIQQLLFRNLLDNVKKLRERIKIYKLENNKVPCADTVVPKLFGTLSLLGQHLGLPLEAGVTAKSFEISWESLKHNYTKIFLEPLDRLESVVELLVKVGLCEKIYEPNEEGVEDFSKVIFKDIHFLDSFVDYYQYHLHRPGSGVNIQYDNQAHLALNSLLMMSDSHEADLQGYMKINYDDFILYCKEKQGFEFKTIHTSLLINKGLRLERKLESKVSFLFFDKDNFEETFNYWCILREIKAWNDKGSITEEEDELRFSIRLP